MTAGGKATRLCPLLLPSNTVVNGEAEAPQNGEKGAFALASLLREDGSRLATEWCPYLGSSVSLRSVSWVCFWPNRPAPDEPGQGTHAGAKPAVGKSRPGGGSVPSHQPGRQGPELQD